MRKWMADRALSASRHDENLYSSTHDSAATASGASEDSAHGRANNEFGGLDAGKRSHETEYKAHLSKYQLQVLENYREMFDMADTLGRGDLDKEQFLEFLLSMGVAMNPEKAQVIFDVVDIDSNGSVSWDEFARVIAAEMRHSTPCSMAEATWSCFDPGKTGQVLKMD